MIKLPKKSIKDYQETIRTRNIDLAKGNLSINESYDMLVESGFTHKEAFGYIAVIVSHKRKKRWT